MHRLSAGGVLHIELGLKVRFYVLRRSALVSDYTDDQVENYTRPARHKRYTRVSHIPTSPHGVGEGYIFVSNLGLDGGGRPAVPEQAVYHVGGGGIPYGLGKVD